jgi:hypothetical protein
LAAGLDRLGSDAEEPRRFARLGHSTGAAERAEGRLEDEGFALAPGEIACDEIGEADELGYHGCFGTVVDLSRLRQLVDSAAEHHGDPVSDDHGFRLVVRDVDRGDAHFLLQGPNVEAHLFSQLGVEIGERLVEQRDVGGDDERACQRRSLLLAARQLARVCLAALASEEIMERRRAGRSAGGRSQ